jgi:hypothetical protein
MQRRSRDSGAGWFPLRGSWEESVLTWNEQVEVSFRRLDQERADPVRVAETGGVITQVGRR